MLFGKKINDYYLRYLPYYIFGLLALVAVDYVQLFVPELYGSVITGINTGFVNVGSDNVPFDMDYLLDRICLPLIGIVLVMVVGRFIWRICFAMSSIKIQTDLRRRMFDKSKDLSQSFYGTNKVGNMMSLYTNDLETIQDCCAWGILMFFDAILLGALAITKMFMMNVYMTLLTLIPSALLLVIAFIVGSNMERKWDARQAAFSDLSDFSQEVYSGLAVVKAFVKETAELMQFKKRNKNSEEANVAFTRVGVTLDILVMLFVESIICVILGFGGYLVHEGVFDVGKLMEFIGYFTAIVWPIMAVGEIINMRSRGKASLNRVFELIDASIDVHDGDNATPCERLEGAIEFRNLTFTYPNSTREILHNVSFKIEAGEHVGLVGRTGSGKTTIVDLILRTYNVPDGTVYVDGKDVNSLTIHSVRENIAYVPQDNFLFSDTISANIAFASDNEDAASVQSAAIFADVNNDITAFPDGYATVMGERGVTVSGGQKQRISIARAFMKHAPVLILDDSVSAVDVGTERMILDHLRDERGDLTTILIAHRISTVENMDKIIFIDDGSIADVGTHDELYARCVEYRKMVDLQRLNAVAEAETAEGGEHNA